MLPEPVPDPYSKFLPDPTRTRGYTVPEESLAQLPRTRSLYCQLAYNSACNCCCCSSPSASSISASSSSRSSSRSRRSRSSSEIAYYVARQNIGLCGFISYLNLFYCHQLTISFRLSSNLMVITTISTKTQLV